MIHFCFLMKALIRMDYMWNYTPNGVVVVVVVVVRQIETTAISIADLEEIICVLLLFILISNVPLRNKKKKWNSIFMKITFIVHKDFDINF